MRRQDLVAAVDGNNCDPFTDAWHMVNYVDGDLNAIESTDTEALNVRDLSTVCDQYRHGQWRVGRKADFPPAITSAFRKLYNLRGIESRALANVRRMSDKWLRDRGLLFTMSELKELTFKLGFRQKSNDSQ